MGRDVNGAGMPASVQWGTLGDRAGGHTHCKRVGLDIRCPGSYLVK
jgi:hypothetical protein